MKLHSFKEVAFATSYVVARTASIGIFGTWGALKGAAFGCYMGAVCSVAPMPKVIVQDQLSLDFTVDDLHSDSSNPYEEIPKVMDKESELTTN